MVIDTETDDEWIEKAIELLASVGMVVIERNLGNQLDGELSALTHGRPVDVEFCRAAYPVIRKSCESANRHHNHEQALYGLIRVADSLSLFAQENGE